MEQKAVKWRHPTQFFMEGYMGSWNKTIDFSQIMKAHAQSFEIGCRAVSAGPCFLKELRDCDNKDSFEALRLTNCSRLKLIVSRNRVTKDEVGMKKAFNSHFWHIM